MLKTPGEFQRCGLGDNGGVRGQSLASPPLYSRSLKGAWQYIGNNGADCRAEIKMHDLISKSLRMNHFLLS